MKTLFEEANDGRRRDGVYEKVMHAMKMLREHKLPFGSSVCYTSEREFKISLKMRRRKMF